MARIHRIAKILLPNRPGLTEDAAQEAALKISRHPHPIENLNAFVFKVVKNEVKDLLRKEIVQRDLRERLEEGKTSP